MLATVVECTDFKVRLQFFIRKLRGLRKFFRDIINYGRGGGDMLVAGITKFHHPFIGGITKFQVSKMGGGVTKSTLNEVHKINFYKVW